MNMGEIFTKLGSEAEPPLVTQLSRLVWITGVVQAAIRLEIFTKLHRKQLNSAEVANLLGSHHHYTELLLNACASVGLLEKIGDEYRNTKESDTYLVKGDPRYYGDLHLIWAMQWPLWDQVDSAILKGTDIPYEPEFKSEQEKEEFWHAYMIFMQEWGASHQPPFLLNNIDLTGKKKLLDIAGGSGIYTIAFCQKYPDLTAVIFDQERALAFARSQIEAQGLSQRISTLGGDFNVDPFGTDYDVVLISGILCLNSLETSRLVFRKAYESMVSGGLIIVQDIMRIGPYTETTPYMAVISVLCALFYGGGGEIHSGHEMAEGLMSVGFTSPEQIPLPGMYSLVTALKP